MGSVAEKVVRLASCPVFTVKAPLLAVPRAAGSDSADLAERDRRGGGKNRWRYQEVKL